MPVGLSAVGAHEVDLAELAETGVDHLLDLGESPDVRHASDRTTTAWLSPGECLPQVVGSRQSVPAGLNLFATRIGGNGVRPLRGEAERMGSSLSTAGARNERASAFGDSNLSTCFLGI